MLKRFLAIILTLLPLATVCQAASAGAMPGDANGDGKVDATDIAYIIDSMLGISHSQMDVDAADVNNDGTIDATDISLVIRNILQGATASVTISGHPFAAHYFLLSESGAISFGITPTAVTEFTDAVIQVSLTDKFTHKIVNGDTGSADGAYFEWSCGGSAAEGLSQVTVRARALSFAIMALVGYKTSEVTGEFDLSNKILELYGDTPGFDGYFPVYLRVKLVTAGGDVVSGNSTMLRHVYPHYISTSIYMLGEFNNWPTPLTANIAAEGESQPAGKLWTLSELYSQPGSDIYCGSFWLEDPAQKEFRFYRSLNGWGAYGSIGGSYADFSSAPIDMYQGSGSAPIVWEGQGNWYMSGFDLPTGWYDFIVDLNTSTISVTNVASPTYPTTFQP